MSVVLTEVTGVPGVSTVRFQITEQMVERFAAITGDRSSLHVSDSFARRSAYRRPVVHGMLPVGFLALGLPRHPTGIRCRPAELTGRFVTPVYIGDRLRLTVTPAQAGDTTIESLFDYQITHDISGTTVTVGTVALTDVAQEPPRGTTTSLAEGMLLGPRDVSTFTLEQIEKGTRDCIDFRISEASVRAFVALLSEGLCDGHVDTMAVSEQLWIPDLLSVLALSTSVGVALPGAAATFLEFAARCSRPVALDSVYHLRGTVTHKSRATRIIKKEVRTSLAAGEDDETDAALTGRVAALLNEPPRAMPTIDQLKRDTATDWGLRGKVVLITGASRGIGETTAKLLALCGAKVVVNYHRGADDASRVVDEIRLNGGQSMAIAADVSDPAQVRAMVERTVAEYGTIDVLVNNAARDFRPIPFLELTWDEVQRDIDVIAKGAFLCCQQIIPLMVQAGGGKIINISSVATDDPPPDQTKYVVAKSALVGLTRSLSIEFAAKNIQVNLVVPNFVETDFVAHIQEGFRKKLAQETPMRRHASSVDVARAVVFLASSFSSFTTGQKIMVTGGGAPYA